MRWGPVYVRLRGIIGEVAGILEKLMEETLGDLQGCILGEKLIGRYRVTVREVGAGAGISP